MMGATDAFELPLVSFGSHTGATDYRIRRPVAADRPDGEKFLAVASGVSSFFGNSDHLPAKSHADSSDSSGTSAIQTS